VSEMKQGFLVLQNGKVFEGKRVGAQGDAFGEAVFTTAMTGIAQTLTDPSYCGQILVATFPLMGNYGLTPEDYESAGPKLSAFVMRECCAVPSNFRSELSLGSFLTENRIPGLCQVDTRALTREIRSVGAMNAALVSKLPENMPQFLERLKNMPSSALVSSVTRKTGTLSAEPGSIVLMDYGYKGSIEKMLQKRGFRVTVAGAYTSAEEVLSLKPAGVMLSNGPGDPADNREIIAEIKKLCESGIPIMGICLGHQLLALACGAETAKLKFGHRGANQPVVDPKTSRMYITSQNHGYAVETLPQNAELLFRNANDGTVEGLYYKDAPAFSVQFHPEANSGPRDTEFLFDDFARMIKEGKNYAALL